MGGCSEGIDGIVRDLQPAHSSPSITVPFIPIAGVDHLSRSDALSAFGQLNPSLRMVGVRNGYLFRLWV